MVWGEELHRFFWLFLWNNGQLHLIHWDCGLWQAQCVHRCHPPERLFSGRAPENSRDSEIQSEWGLAGCSRDTAAQNSCLLIAVCQVGWTDLERTGHLSPPGFWRGGLIFVSLWYSLLFGGRLIIKMLGTKLSTKYTWSIGPGTIGACPYWTGFTEHLFWY